VRSGQLAYLLGRPCNYVLYHFASYLGERLTRIAISGPVAIVLALLFVGLPHLSLWGMLVWPLLALLAMTLEFVIQFSIGLLAFWIEETTSFALIFNRLTLLFGGVLLPLSIFPEPLRSITEALPFSAIAYGPARTLVHFEPAFFWTLLVRQLITVLVLGLLLALLYRAALRRTSINGG
jgi:ABC-2 type transport system permease protein